MCTDGYQGANDYMRLDDEMSDLGLGNVFYIIFTAAGVKGQYNKL